MAVTLTESAARHVTKMLEQRGHGLGLRIGTKKSGCSGFAYAVDYADDLGSDDQVFESHGVKVVVDGKGRCQGILDIEVLADVLKRLRAQAKKHYEQLAVQEAALAAANGSNGPGTGGR